jgi:hypothetical protein
MGDRFDCSFNLVMTPLFNLSTALLGSHRAPSTALVLVRAKELVAWETVGVEGDSSLGFSSAMIGAGSPSFCLT